MDVLHFVAGFVLLIFGLLGSYFILEDLREHGGIHFDPSPERVYPPSHGQFWVIVAFCAAALIGGVALVTG